MKRAFAMSLVAVAWLGLPLPASAITCQHPAGGVLLDPYGDVNASGTVNVADAHCAALAVLATQLSQPLSSVACISGSGSVVDLTCNGAVSISDVTLLVNIAIGLGVPAAMAPDAQGCPAVCAPCNGGGASCLIAGACVPDGDRSGPDGCLVCDPGSSPTDWTTESPSTWYLDSDDDTYGVLTDTNLACTGLGDYTATEGGDCDDSNAGINPGAAEICGNSVDEDCDGNTDNDCGPAPSVHAPLDELPASGAALSLRRLSSSYGGAAIRVRRSSDNAESDIGFTAGGDLNASALLNFCASTNCGVTTWYDQSGNSRHFTQSSAASQPLIVQSGAVVTRNGRPAIRFAAHWMATGTHDWGTEFSVFLVHGLLANGFADSTGPGTYFRILETRYQTHFYLGSNAVPTAYQVIVNSPSSPHGAIIGGTPAGGVLRGISSITAAGSSDLRLDGALIASDTVAPPTSGSNIMYLNRYYGGGYSANGYYSELVWFDSALTANQRTVMSSSQTCYFGLDPTALDGNGNGVADACEQPVGTTCTDLLDAGETTSGLYFIDPDGENGDPPYQVYCDMSIGNVGWTLAMNLDTSDGHVMWWAENLWTNGATYGSVGTPFEGDLVSPAWSSLSGATRLLLVVHEQGSIVGWKQFEKVNGSTMRQHLQSGDNTLIGTRVLASDTASIWSKEFLVRASTTLYANHCNYGTCTVSAGGSPDGDRIGSHQSAPTNNQGGGLGNWHDMGYCCSNQSYGGRPCNGSAFRTVSEAQAGWCPTYGDPTTNNGYFGTDTFAPAPCSQTDAICGNAAWSSPNNRNYDYAIYVGHRPILGASSSSPGASCRDILDSSASVGTGLYWIDPDGAGGTAPIQVYCDMTTEGGGWTLLGYSSNSASNAAKDVSRLGTWSTYTSTGYGTPGLTSSTMYWLALEYWHDLTTTFADNVFRVHDPGHDMRVNDLVIGTSAQKYPWNWTNAVSGYDDILAGNSGAADVKGRKFTTRDNDNDVWPNNCAKDNIGDNGGWWYSNCWQNSMVHADYTVRSWWKNAVSSAGAVSWLALWFREN